MKKVTLLFLAAVLFLSLSAPAVSSTDEPAPPAAPDTAIGFARELSLLVLGIGWEAVRIVLPDSCPAKHKDIDGLIGGTRTDN